MSAVKKQFFDVSKVQQEAQGRWMEILYALGGDYLSEALDKPGKHVTCPVHGTSAKNGKGDGFRVMKDVAEHGKGICNSCGPQSGGFALLMWVHNANFLTVLTDVANFLRVAPEPPKRQAQALRVVNSNASAIPEVSQEQNAQAPMPASQLLAGKAMPTEEEMAKIVEHQKSTAKKNTESAKKSEASISRVWSESSPLSLGLPRAIFRFWKARNIMLARPKRLLDGDAVRYHPELPYYQENEEGNMELAGKYPSLVSAIRDYKGEIVTLHRTYLSAGGDKAPVADARKMMSVPCSKSVTGGCAIQLGGQPVNGVLSVAEGQETALAVMKAYSEFPTWSTVNATLLEMFMPPEGTKVLLVWEDKDRSLAGQRAANNLKARLEPLGITVHIISINRRIPDGEKSIDWNDIMVKEGRWGFPALANIRKLIELK